MSRSLAKNKAGKYTLSIRTVEQPCIHLVAEVRLQRGKRKMHFDLSAAKCAEWADAICHNGTVKLYGGLFHGYELVLEHGCIASGTPDPYRWPLLPSRAVVLDSVSARADFVEVLRALAK